MELFRCRAVRRPSSSSSASSSSTFFKSNRLLHVLSYLSDIWLESAQQYCPKTCVIRILIFGFSFFNGFLITKIGIFGGSGPLAQKVFNVRPWNLIYRQIAGTSRCVWNMGPVCKFSDPFWPQIVPKLGRKPVFHLFCKRLPLDSHETCLLSSMELLLKVCRILALDSHGSCLLSSLELLFGGLRIWAPWGLWGLFAAIVRFLYSHSLYYFWVVMDRFSTLISWII